MENTNTGAVRISARRDFISLAVAEMVAKGDPIQGGSFAAARGHTRVAAEIKASVEAMGTANGAPLVSQIGTDYGREIAAETLPGRLAGIDRVPFNTRLVDGNGEIVASWAAPGAPLPVSEGAFLEADPLPIRKLGTILIFSAELVRSTSPSARAKIEARIDRAVKTMVDTSFVDPTFAGVAGESPASISYGAPSIPASGSTVEDIENDAASLLDILVDGGSDLASAYWLMSPKTAIAWGAKRTNGNLAFPKLSAKAGGEFMGLPVLISPSVRVQGSPPENIVVLVDAAGVALSDDGQTEVSQSGAASVQLSSTPSAGAQPQVSLWQKNLSGLRVVRFITWARRRPAAVATLRHVQL